MLPRPPRVLIIDDHDEFRSLLKHHLTSEWAGASIQELNPREQFSAIENINPEKYDLVLLDHELGPCNGLQLLTRFRKINQFPPIIYLTAAGDERLAALAIKTGADDYIPKRELSHQLFITTVRETLRVRQKSASKVSLGEATDTISNATAGVQIRGYELKRKIASGSSSAIYLAYSKSREEDVVLKLLYGMLDLSDESEVLERFLIEYQSISSIDHPNIVRIFDVGVADDHAYIAMEFLGGGDLRDRLRAAGRFAPRDAIKTIIGVADSLSSMHAVDILHRDLKPANVMFRDNEEPCLIDFGLAKQVQLDQDITQPGRIYGTPYYMSPEQAQGLEIDHRSDYYSLGVMLFELLMGHKPFVAGTPVALLFKHAHAAIPDLNENIKQYQPLIDQLLAKDPAVRPADHKHLLGVLKEYERL